MRYSSLIQNISQLKSIPLKGREAHKELAPPGRSLEQPDSFVPAGVMIAVFPGVHGQAHFLLTRRAEYEGVHSGQISLPGGKTKDDENPLQAAIRETREETALETADGIITALSPLYIPVSGIKVYPYLAHIENIESLQTNHEVSGVLLPRLQDLMDSDISYGLQSPGYPPGNRIPCFWLENAQVWGATAMILNELKYLLKALF